MNIRSLQSNMSRDSAMRKFAPPGSHGVARRWLSGNLRALAEVYLPYRLYKVSIDDRRVQTVRYLAVDAAAGTLDPYEFAAPPLAETFTEVETRNFHPVRLDEKQTNQRAIENVRRWMFSRGFFRLSNPVMSADLVQLEFFIPYWAAFYGNDGNLNVMVLNAVRQTHEGSKVRRLIKTWLLDRPMQPSKAISILSS
jgi:hypothetical protein